MALQRIAAGVAALTCIFTPGLGGAAAQTPALAPHRAIYDLSLLRADGAKAPSEARGRITFDFSGSACDGYIQNVRQLTQLQPQEGEAQVSDMRSATFEAADGSDFRFKLTTKVSNAESAGATEETDGVAKKKKSGDVEIDLSKPKRGKLDYAGPILFPTDHMRKILQTARDGGKMLAARVYDGSGDGSKRFDTLSIIGAPIQIEPQEKAFQVEAFKNLRRWPVTISYFDIEQKDQLPSYTLMLELFENGVTYSMRLDYGDFVLGAKASSLTLLPPPKCKRPN
ncbi:cell envelope integrity EipB family protein [Methylocystis bryophila]|uniref:ATP-binding protein n=1 Tax=Methylocystis bryophila TaxID=655015 RepID=A0A1W6MUW7_9HYPH|nr:cell envelope integrity EipB family protein [Methylocystis bryophila]ARN81393.1 hypothetical protein B1812_10245 [Methylocystis bryophila]BDV37386.1 hypothetical protein DSM21852_06390 [Methylocystis bryophila]